MAFLFEFPSSTDVGSHNPSSLTHCPRSALFPFPTDRAFLFKFSSSTDVGSHNPSSLTHCPRSALFPFPTDRAFLFEFPSSTNVRSHNPPHWVQASSLTHCLRNALFPFPTDMGSHNLPFRGLVSSLTHHPMSASDTICNDPSPQLVDIVLFGLFLPSIPQSF